MWTINMVRKGAEPYTIHTPSSITAFAVAKALQSYFHADVVLSCDGEIKKTLFAVKRGNERKQVTTITGERTRRHI